MSEDLPPIPEPTLADLVNRMGREDPRATFQVLILLVRKYGEPGPSGDKGVRLDTEDMKLATGQALVWGNLAGSPGTTLIKAVRLGPQSGELDP